MSETPTRDTGGQEQAPLSEPESKVAAWNGVRSEACKIAEGKSIAGLLAAVDAFGFACERGQDQRVVKLAPSGYEATTACYTKFISPARYAKLKPAFQKWYRPYWVGGAQAVPAGFAIVPVEPTLEMLVAGTEDWMTVRASEDRANVIWAAMLAAAPQPQQEQALGAPIAQEHAAELAQLSVDAEALHREYLRGVEDGSQKAHEDMQPAIGMLGAELSRLRLGAQQEQVQAPAPGDGLANVELTAPKSIYLVIGEDCPSEADFTDCDEVTWCQDKIDENSIKYIRADLASAQAPASGAGRWVSADDVDRLVRELDVALNGKAAAPQARLCDLVAEVQRTRQQPLTQEWAYELIDRHASNRLLNTLVQINEARDDCEVCPDVIEFMAAIMRTAGVPSPAEVDGLDRDEAIRVWHKHCDKYSKLWGDVPASSVIDAMLDFARANVQPKGSV